jgi:uncharacterized protein
MTVCDANIGLGRFATGVVPPFQSASEVLAYMDQLGIGEAVVYSVLARESGPEIGNEWLVRETAGNPRLHPCLTLVPGDASLAATLALMRTRHIPCGRIFPRAGHFSVRPWCLAPVAEGLLSLPQAVLFIDFELTSWGDDTLDWEGVRDLCVRYPGLPVVVVCASITAPRLYDRLMTDCPNLHLEISNLHVPGELERLCANGFGRRILFGSDSPINFAGGALSQVRHATLDETNRGNILAGNMQRLMSSNPRQDSAAPASSPLLPAIDMHVHYGRWHHSVCGPGDADGMIREMNRCGIAKAMLTSIDACYGGVKAGNDAVADACRRYPGRLFGYITIDPKHRGEVEDELRRHGADAAFRGLKFHASVHGVQLADPRYAIALEFADSRGWPVLIHAPDDAQAWLDACERYPNAKLLAAHVGGITLTREEEKRLVLGCRDHANLFLDLASGNMTPGILERLVEMAGVDRVVYGSDYPIFDFGYERGRVDFSSLSQAEKTRILSGNAEALLKISGAGA